MDDQEVKLRFKVAKKRFYFIVLATLISFFGGIALKSWGIDIINPFFSALIANIPKERFRSIDGSVPEVGDVIALDQGLTFPDGEPGCLVYGLEQEGQYKYEAEIYDSEIGEDINT